jgi:hypothetical protein
MFKHVAILLTAELGTTPACIQSVYAYAWALHVAFFGMKTVHLISYAMIFFPRSLLGFCCIFQALKGFRDEISITNDILGYFELEYF